MEYIVFDKYLHKSIMDGIPFNTLEEAEKDAKERLKISFVDGIKIYKVDFLKKVV